jgi:para-nitrobenzyl esterase
MEIGFMVRTWLLFGCALGIANAQGGPTAAVTGGQVRGRADGAGAIFKGIPFAAAPSGDLRWREPAPVKPWNGVRETVEYGAPCAQIAAGWNDKVAAAGSEDCLFLNVWAPEWPAGSRKPVMFWIHGGANQGGSAMGAAGIEPPFDGAKLAARGVVVVTINYRLGMFGFLAHPELTAESKHHASGNYGLLDQVAALHWVKENIARFGGDPAQVTIFGQSAGAHDVGLLLTSPLAKGLFARAAAQSGTVIIGGKLTPSLATLEKAGMALATQMGAPDKGAVAHMRKLSAAEVLKAAPAYSAQGPLRPEPNVDGYAVPRLPAAVYRAGEEAAVPLIIGNNGRERSIQGGPDAARKAIEDYYGSLAPKAMQIYNAKPGYPPHGDTGSQFQTDNMFRCGAATIAQWHAAKSPAYEYEFTQAYEPRGAVHSWELQYVFGMLGKDASQPMDRKVSDQVQQYWANFAKTGNPNGESLPVWPKVDAKRSYLEFTADGPISKTGLRQAACELFQEKVAADIAARGK